MSKSNSFVMYRKNIKYINMIIQARIIVLMRRHRVVDNKLVYTVGMGVHWCISVDDLGLGLGPLIPWGV